MKVKRYKDYIKEGLNDLRTVMRSHGQTKEYDPNHFSNSEVMFISNIGGEFIDESTAQLPTGEIIKKTHLGYSLEKNGNQEIFIRQSKFKTIPSDFEVFKTQVERYLQDQNI